MQDSFLYQLVWLIAGIAIIVVLTARYRVHAFFALLISCFVVGLGVQLPMEAVILAVKEGFGNIMKSLGIIIVLGTALGVILEKTGSTRVMADFILRKVGESRAPIAMSITGFIVGLPIFCDSGYIVLSGLNNSLAKRTGIPIAIMAVSLATGLYAVHCLIPPHPGAAAAAGLLEVDFGVLIMAGILVAIPAMIVGHLWARYAGKQAIEVNHFYRHWDWQRAMDRYYVLAMGAGSMLISHANDAYFWVIAKFSGLDMKTMLNVYTIATVLMGLTSIVMVYILSKVL